MRDLQFTRRDLKPVIKGKLFSCDLKKQSVLYSQIPDPYVLTLWDYGI